MYEQEQDEEKFVEPKRARRIRERTRIEIRRSHKHRVYSVPVTYTRRRKYKEEWS
jgi:hypothetical protein